MAPRVFLRTAARRRSALPRCSGPPTRSSRTLTSTTGPKLRPSRAIATLPSKTTAYAVVSSPTATAAGPFDAESRLAARFLRAVGAPASRRLSRRRPRRPTALPRAPASRARSARRARCASRRAAWPPTAARIESLDVSHGMGAAAVVACASAREGVAAPAEHRRWAVSGAVTPSDDRAAARGRAGSSPVRRRGSAAGRPPSRRRRQSAARGRRRGGRSAAAAGRRFAGAPPLVARSKQEDVYVEGDAAPLRRPAGGRAAALLVLRRARDEAHSGAARAPTPPRRCRLRDALASPACVARRDGRAALLARFESGRPTPRPKRSCAQSRAGPECRCSPRALSTPPAPAAPPPRRERAPPEPPAPRPGTPTPAWLGSGRVAPVRPLRAARRRAIRVAPPRRRRHSIKDGPLGRRAADGMRPSAVRC